MDRCACPSGAHIPVKIREYGGHRIQSVVRIWETQNANDDILASENSESLRTTSQHRTVDKALQQHLVNLKEAGPEA